jgi:hypothetical protein
VHGRDPHTGECFIITNVSWDGEQLSFDSFVASSEYGAKHTMRVATDSDHVEHELTLLEIWRRKGETGKQ